MNPESISGYAPVVATLLWAALCLRLYLTLSANNPWQRRLISIIGAAVAGLIYVVMHQLFTPLKPAPDAPAEQSVESIQISSQKAEP
jgi:hypothetical protein